MSLKNALIMQNDNGTTTTAIQIDTAITSNNVPVVINAAGNVGVATDTPLATLDVGGTGALKVPVGTDAQRPSLEATGQFRFNSDTGQFEGYNGTDWGPLGGGGGTALELYAENPSSPTAPSATGTNAVAIGDGATASGDNANAFGDGTASGNFSTAIGYFSTSSGLSSLAAGSGANAAASASTAIGRNSSGGGSQTVGGTGAMALGGSRASGTDSFAAAIANNTSSFGATGANSVAIGQKAKSTGTGSVAIGYQADATSNRAVVVGGTNSDASGFCSASIGADTSQALGAFTFVSGSRAKAIEIGKSARASGLFSQAGDAQSGTFVLRSDTTDATPEALTSTNSSASTTNQIILPNNSAYAFHGTIVARQQASQGTACAAFKIEGLIRREGNAASTVLVNSATTILDNTPGFGMTLSADTTNGGLKIEVTGLAATNIRFVATVHTSEVTF